MDAEADKHLFWIAKEGLLAPMPPHWEPTQDANGGTYYYNFVTHAVQERHPNDTIYYDKYLVEKAKWQKV